MIHVFQYPTEKAPVLGYTYHFYDHMEIHTDYKKFPNVPTALAYFQDAKISVLGCNLEKFRNHSHIIFKIDDEDTPHMLKEAVQVISLLLDYILKHKEKYVDCLENVLDKANFMRVLVKNSPEAERPIMIMMVACILDFCKVEIDERKKTPGQG